MTTCATCGAFISHEGSTAPVRCGTCTGSVSYTSDPRAVVLNSELPLPVFALTPRDLFAAAALAGMLAYRGHEYHEFVIDASARDAFEWADAMLAARKGER